MKWLPILGMDDKWHYIYIHFRIGGYFQVIMKWLPVLNWWLFSKWLRCKNSQKRILTKNMEYKKIHSFLLFFVGLFIFNIFLNLVETLFYDWNCNLMFLYNLCLSGSYSLFDITGHEYSSSLCKCWLFSQPTTKNYRSVICLWCKTGGWV